MIYLDYAASTPAYTEVCAETARIMADIYGNPSSVHAAGAAARRVLRESRKTLASLIGFAPESVIFTSGGTESNNTALMSVRNLSRRHIVVSAIEHHSVLNAAAELKKLGFSVTEVLPDRRGMISPEAVANALKPDTALISVQAVNNETGTVQDIAAIAELAHKFGALYHCDAVQSFGHINSPLSCADMISLSAHKFGGPRGVGALVVKPAALNSPYFFGGNQEFGLRAGTENLPAISGFALAAELSANTLSAEYERLKTLSALLLSLLENGIPALELNSGDAERSPAILNIRFPGLSAEELMTQLNEKGICISTGAACTLGDKSPSHVLTAMGLSASKAKESVRMSLGRLTTEEEIRTAAKEITAIYNACIK